jgi:signal transduction histidine kinase
MIKPPLPINEATRLDALREYDVLDTPPEAAFDDLARLASQICGTPVAMISLVDGDRQWFKAKVGTELTETPRDVAFCAHAILQPDLFIIPDAEADVRFVDNPLVTTDPHVRFYAGAPLVTPDGHALGTLCAVDQVARELSPEQQAALRALARQAMDQFQLRRSLKQLRELEALKDNLTGMIIHDLRTPLTALLGGLQTIERAGELNETQSELLQLSVQGGQTLLGMVNDLLDISKLENGSLKLEYAGIRADALVQQALRQVAPLAAEKRIRLRHDLPAGPLCLSADEEKLVRTLVNLLGNAIKFTPSGGTVSLCVHRSDHEAALTFQVADTGEGIPAEAFERIFEKFGQVESRHAGRRMSTGLGLTFCKMVVEAHGGRIWVESDLGHGSTFSFIIPHA